MVLNRGLGWQGESVRSHESGRRALTLLELLVVLVILAIVATVAVNSLQPRVQTARFEQTRELIQNVQKSIVGIKGSRQTGGTPLITGFVADVGRLPRPPALPMQSDTEPGGELFELWSSESALAQEFPFRFRKGPTTPVDYSSIQIPCGWRGPYLQLPLGETRLVDSWGRPFEYQYTSKGTIDCIVWQPIGDYDTPIQCQLKSAKVTVTGTIDFGDFEPNQVEVVLLGPDPDSSLSELSVFADEDDSPLTFTFSDVSIGLRAIHIRFDDQTLTRYVQVPHAGLTLAMDATGRIPTGAASQ